MSLIFLESYGCLFSGAFRGLLISLEEVMAVLTLKGFQDAEQFVTALKAINPIKLAAKNKSADTSSNIR